jgi:hypothetical protein
LGRRTGYSEHHSGNWKPGNFLRRQLKPYEIVERTGLDSSEVLATLFDLGEERVCPGRAGQKVQRDIIAGESAKPIRFAYAKTGRASAFRILLNTLRLSET